MFIHESKLRVRYGETDQMGYAYYGNYAQFFEVARVEMLRSMGFSYKGFEADGVMMPVLELKCKYIRPAKYDDELTIRTTLKEMPTARIHFFYEVFNEQKELIHLGETILVFVNMQTNRPCKAPAYFSDQLKPYFDIDEVALL